MGVNSKKLNRNNINLMTKCENLVSRQTYVNYTEAGHHEKGTIHREQLPTLNRKETRLYIRWRFYKKFFAL